MWVAYLLPPVSGDNGAVVRDVKLEPVAVEPREFRNTLSRFASGVTVVTTVDEGSVHGMTVSAFMSVSLEPLLIAISIEKRARTHGLLAAVGRFGVSVLADGQEAYSRHFAGTPQPELPPAYQWHQGAALLPDALAHLICRVVAAYPGGDHTIYLGEVEYLAYRRGGRPLVHYNGQYGTIAPQATS